MQPTHRITDEQQALWNGRAGEAWVDGQELLDQLFQPFEDLLANTVAEGASAQVLDVGCGTGGTTLAVARRLGLGGKAVGVDISAPMLAAARVRAEREAAAATFILGDAETHAFEPARFDAVISRFGVMFFADTLRAFENLRRASRPGAQLTLLTWRSPAENPFMTTAERTAAPLLPDMPARRPDAPGQFAFADAQRVHGILEQSGWVDVDISPLDVTCTMPERSLVYYVTRLGPLGLILQDADAPTRARVLDAVLAAFAPYVHGAQVRFAAACWTVRARAPSVSGA
jgi:SAM-dependent methyltransferase